MTMLASLAAGAVGASALTGVHQLGRATLREPPRMDVLGRRALRRLGVRMRGREQQRAALLGDLLANTLWYALATSSRTRMPVWRGLAFGIAAGVGALVLPGTLGLGARPSRRTASTAVATVAWYALGGLATGYASRWIRGRSREPAHLGREARWLPFAPAP